GAAGNDEPGEEGEGPATTAGVRVRREQRMVEEVVHVGAELQGDAFGGVKILVKTKVQAPSAGSPKHIALGNRRIAENVRAHRRWAEGGRIEDLVAVALVEVVAEHDWPIGRLGVEIADGVD